MRSPSRLITRLVLSLLLALSVSVGFIGTPAQAEGASGSARVVDPCLQTVRRAGESDDDLKKRSEAVLIHLPNFTNPECQKYTVVLSLLKEFANVAIQFVLAIALIFLIITGYQFVTSVGDKAGMENAKRSLLFIVIGILAVLGAFMLVRYISNQFLSDRYKITLGDAPTPTSPDGSVVGWPDGRQS